MSYAMKISEISETKENYKYFLSNKNVSVKKKRKRNVSGDIIKNIRQRQNSFGKKRERAIKYRCLMGKGTRTGI